MQDVHTGEELIFICDRWMSRDEDDGDVCRELAVSRDDQPLTGLQVLVASTQLETDCFLWEFLFKCIPLIRSSFVDFTHKKLLWFSLHFLPPQFFFMLFIHLQKKYFV